MRLVLHDLLLCTLRSLFSKKPQFLCLIFNSRIFNNLHSNLAIFLCPFWNLGDPLPHDVSEIITKVLGSACRFFPDAVRSLPGREGKTLVVGGSLVGADRGSWWLLPKAPAWQDFLTLSRLSKKSCCHVMGKVIVPKETSGCVRRLYFWPGARCFLLFLYHPKLYFPYALLSYFIFILKTFCIKG